MLILYNNDDGYILVVKYWNSVTGNICGVKKIILGEFEPIHKFKRFFYDSTFNNIYLFVVEKDLLYRSE